MRPATMRAAARVRPAVSAPARGMATEKQLAMRIAGTKNITKITKSMKMVSASKLRNDQLRLDVARPFNRWSNAISDIGTTAETVDVSEWPQKNLIVPLTSDKGLCGGVNTFITRAIRNIVHDVQDSGKEVHLLVVGEKGRSQLSRAFGDLVLRSCSEVSAPYNFSCATAIAMEVLKNNYDSVHLVYNKFRSAIAYDTTVATVANLSAAGLAEKEEPLLAYEFEPDTKTEVLDDLSEYLLASKLYYAMMEGATSEQSSRMNAMENASKNGQEMIEKLTLQYNRARQARITTELIEIISGAAALEG